MARKQGLRRGSNMPSFFKVLIGDFYKQLQIPPAFLKYFDGVWPKKFLLWTPTRRLWHVDVIKIDNNLFFEKGWSEFVQDHFLELGDFLVFKYDRESKFYVNIYGRNACEKDTSKVAKNGGKLLSCKESKKLKKTSSMSEARHSSDIQMESQRKLDKKGLKESNGNGANQVKPIVNGVFQVKEEPEDEVSNETLDQILKRLKKRKKAPPQSIRSCKLEPLIPRIQPQDIEASAMKHKKSKRVVNSHSFLQESGEIGKEVQRSKPTTKRRRLLKELEKLTAKSKAKALQIAKTFKSENPFFVVTMHPSYITGRALSVPISFASKYFAEDAKDVTLRASDGSSWTVKGRLKAYGERLSSQIYCGWGAFARANNLKVGDVCAFELVNVTEMCLELVKL